MEAREFGRRYQETYIRYIPPKSEKPIPVYVHAAGYNRTGTVDLKLEDCYNNIYHCSTKGDDLDLSFPPLGFFSHENLTFFLERAPHRQWKWGLSSANSFLIMPFGKWCGARVHNFIKDKFLTNVSLSVLQIPSTRHLLHVGRVHAIFNQTFHSYDEAIKRLTERVMIPINRQMAVSVSPNTPDYMFWIGLNPMAQINHNNPKDIKVLDPALKQELVDYFNRNERFDIHVE
jgi:hypothetical protein